MSASTNARMSMGHVSDVSEEIATIKTHWGEQAQLAFAENSFEFMALNATLETAELNIQSLESSGFIFLLQLHGNFTVP